MTQHEQFADEPARIEAELARERAVLAGSIHALRSSVTFDNLLDEAAAFAKSRLGPMVAAVDTAVRAQPLAAGLAAAGMAWLIFGRKAPAAAPRQAGTLRDAVARWEDEGGPPLPHDEDWLTETDSLRNRASAALADLDRAAREHLRPAADLARERAAIVGDMAASTRKAMARGLEAMSDTARDQIIAARERAYAARLAFSQRGHALIEEYPLLTGAVALAAGAVLGRSLPVTETEHRVLGPERDRLLAEAQRLLAAERARLVSALSAA